MNSTIHKYYDQIIKMHDTTLIYENIKNDMIMNKYKSINKNKVYNPKIEYMMIIDIETNGRDYIVQIAYDICDLDYKVVRQENFYLNDGSDTTDYYRKISRKTIIEKGIHHTIALNQLSIDMAKCKYIVGHNIINFDIKKIIIDFKKYDIKYTIPIPLDTMKSTRTYVNAKDKNGRTKFPKLEELYFHLYQQQMDSDDSHTADYDVYATRMCCIKLKENNVDISFKTVV